MDKKNEREYKISYVKTLPSVNDGKRGLFYIVTSSKTIPVEITISGTFLATWGRDKEDTLMEVGSLLSECMFVYDKVHDMTLVTTDFPQDFQTGEEGYARLKSHIQRQIDLKKINVKIEKGQLKEDFDRDIYWGRIFFTSNDETKTTKVLVYATLEYFQGYYKKADISGEDLNQWLDDVVIKKWSVLKNDILKQDVHYDIYTTSDDSEAKALEYLMNKI